MADLDSVTTIRDAFYRLVGTVPADTALSELSEGENDVAYLYLTQGCRDAQDYMLDQKYLGWRKRSDALTWTGTDATTGGRYSSLPSDYLRADGSRERSALVLVGGNRWGHQVEQEDDIIKGNYFYFIGDQLWLARGASPPTVYLKFHYMHPEWTADVTIDFPLKARSLVVAYAADLASNENWFTGDAEEKTAIRKAVLQAENNARKYARQTKQGRQWRKQRVLGRF